MNDLSKLSVKELLELMVKVLKETKPNQKEISK